MIIQEFSPTVARIIQEDLLINPEKELTKKFCYKVVSMTKYQAVTTGINQKNQQKLKIIREIMQKVAQNSKENKL